MKMAAIHFPAARLAGTGAAAVAMAPPTVYYYHDGRHPLIYMYEPPITQEQYEHCVDELIGTPVEVLSFCLGDGRTMLHDTKVGELWGNNVEDGSHPAIGDDGWDHAIFRRAHQNATHLISQGLDPLTVVVDRAHARGMKLYPCLLVQTPPDGGVRCSTWHQEHATEYAIGRDGDEGLGGNSADCFDFAIPAVREERMALIREAIQGYDIDGFELNMNYSRYYFHPSRMEEGAEIMTQWIAEVRALLTEARGVDAELVVRVPGLNICDAQGLAVREWCATGLVDVVIGENTDGNRCDPNMDWRPMIAAASGTATRVLASVYSYLNSDRLDQAPLPMIRAAACNAWAQGVDGIYINQWYHMWPFQGDFYEKLREVSFPEIMAPKDKSYYVLTDAETPYPDGLPPLGSGTEDLQPLPSEVPCTVSMEITDELAKYAAEGQVHSVLLRFRVQGATELDVLTFSLNGQPLPQEPACLRRINEMYRMTAPRYRVNNSYWFCFELLHFAEHWPVPGSNSISVECEHRDGALAASVLLTVRDVELDVQYLPGRAWHRGQDPALGPSILADSRPKL